MLMATVPVISVMRVRSFLRKFSSFLLHSGIGLALPAVRGRERAVSSASRAGALGLLVVGYGIVLYFKLIVHHGNLLFVFSSCIY